MKYFKKLEGERIYLSPMNINDADIYTQWINDLDVSTRLGNSHNVYGLEREKEAIEKLSKEGHNFAIILKSEDKLIGNCSLMNINNIHRTAELGIFIGDKDYRGNGYGSEAIKIILSYGFKILNLNNIMLKVFSFNENAINAYKKVGFREFGKRSQSYYLNGKYYDDIHMEILQKDFKCEYLDEKLPKEK